MVLGQYPLDRDSTFTYQVVSVRSVFVSASPRRMIIMKSLTMSMKKWSQSANSISGKAPAKGKELRRVSVETTNNPYVAKRYVAKDEG